jgi:hypothetical protein
MSKIGERVGCVLYHLTPVCVVLGSGPDQDLSSQQHLPVAVQINQLPCCGSQRKSTSQGKGAPCMSCMVATRALTKSFLVTNCLLTSARRHGKLIGANHENPRSVSQPVA